MPLSNVRTPVSSWVTEARELRPGLLTGRTLLPDCDQFADVEFVNLSDKTQRLCSGLFIGSAEPGFVVNKSCQSDGEAERTSAAVGSVAGLDVCAPGPGACAPIVTSAGEPNWLPNKECLPGVEPENCEPAGLGDTTDILVSATISEPNRLVLREPGQSGDVIITAQGKSATSAEISEPNRLAQGVGPNTLADPVRGLAGSQPTVVSKFDECCGVLPVFDTESFACCSLLSNLLSSKSAHVEPVIDSMPNDLTDDERYCAAKLIVGNADLFSAHEFDFGRTDKLTHRIHTCDCRPIAQPLRGQWHQWIIHTDSMKTGNRYNCRQTGSSYISGNRRAR